jgi:hypothetical protein
MFAFLMPLLRKAEPPPQPPMSLGNQRLMQLAGIVENAEHYNQGVFYRDISRALGGCALGLWAEHNPERWEQLPVTAIGGETLGWEPRFKGAKPRNWSLDMLLDNSAYHDAMKEFDLSPSEAIDLFGVCGCGNAGCDSRKAATFIRAFVKQRMVEAQLTGITEGEWAKAA